MKKIVTLVTVLFLFSQFSFSEIIDKIVAIVNDDVVTETDMDFILSPLYAKLRSKLSGNELHKKMVKAREEALHQLVDRKLIVQEAYKKEMKIDKEELDLKIDEIRKKFDSYQTFIEALKRDSLTLQDLRERIEEQLLIKKITQEEVLSLVVVSPNEIKTYYDEHSEEYREDETISVSHILIKKKEGEDASAEITDIYEKLKSGEDFATLARKHSEGPNAEKGGDLGFIARGQMLKQIEEAAFTMKVGEISEIIETDLGYHIIKIHVRKEERIKPLVEVWSEIKNELFQKKAMEAHNEWVKKLRNKAYIVIM